MIDRFINGTYARWYCVYTDNDKRLPKKLYVIYIKLQFPSTFSITANNVVWKKLIMQCEIYVDSLYQCCIMMSYSFVFQEHGSSSIDGL